MVPGHLTQNLEADNSATFYFVDGLYAVPPFKDVEYQCPPPNPIYFLYSGIRAHGASFHGRLDVMGLRNADKPHECMRDLWQEYGFQDHHNATSVTPEYLQNIIEEERPFHGVIGASEGGVAAAALLLDHLQRSRDANEDATMICGVFFISAPALQSDGMKYVLADGTDERISVPTCHTYSDLDPIAWMSRCLVETCQEEGRELTLHDKGHTITHNKELMVEVANFIRRIKAAAAKPSVV